MANRKSALLSGIIKLMGGLKKLIFILAFLFIGKIPSEAAVLEQKTVINRIKIPPSFTVAVSARIGGYLFDIKGLTSPWAKVKFFSTQGNVNLETVADDQGVFHFSNALMPLSTGDFCFTSIDTDRRASPPLCFSPPPPQTRTRIGGIILPPTLTINKSVFKQGETVMAQGRTAPYAQIKVFLFEEERTPFWELLDVFVPQALAREGPAAIVTADRRGNFSFNLPSFKSSRWRVFVGTQRTQWGDNPSPKSNILTFASLSWWRWFLLLLLAKLIRFLALSGRFLLQPETIILLLFAAIGAMIHLIKNRPRENPIKGKLMVK